MTPDPIADGCRFTTARLSVATWRGQAEAHGLILEDVVTRLLTATTTRALPPEWHGDYDQDRAREWVAARDAESPTLLAVDEASGSPVGLVILFELHEPGEKVVDLRLGYLIAEEAWSRGYATELVDGLVRWAGDQPTIATITGGVAHDNPASAAVLTKAGFALTGVSGGGEHLFERRFDRGR